MPHYTLHEQLGEGAYGTVYRATCSQTGAIRAVKVMPTDENGIAYSTLREVAALSVIVHDNVIDMHDVWIKGASVMMSLQYCQSDLRAFMANGLLPLPLVRSFFRQLCHGTLAIHQNGFLHRDLKPQNILVLNAVQIKIADFGMSRMVVGDQPKTVEIMTRWYRAPEIILGCKQYGTNVDIWSIGCILGEMALGFVLFPGESDIDTVNRIFKLLGTPARSSMSHCPDFGSVKFDNFPRCDMGREFERVGVDGVAVLEGMLDYSPTSRATLSKIASSTFCNCA